VFLSTGIGVFAAAHQHRVVAINKRQRLAKRMVAALAASGALARQHPPRPHSSFLSAAQPGDGEGPAAQWRRGGISNESKK